MIGNYKNAQEIFDRLSVIKETIKELSEEKTALMQDFYDHFDDYEFPVTHEGKEKFFRVYEVEGRFVYNTNVDFGVRAKPLKLYEGA